MNPELLIGKVFKAKYCDFLEKNVQLTLTDLKKDFFDFKFFKFRMKITIIPIYGPFQSNRTKNGYFWKKKLYQLKVLNCSEFSTRNNVDSVCNIRYARYFYENLCKKCKNFIAFSWYSVRFFLLSPADFSLNLLFFDHSFQMPSNARRLSTIIYSNSM